MKTLSKVKTLAAGSASVIATALNAGVANAAKYYCPGTQTAVPDLSQCTTGDNAINSESNSQDLISVVNTIINVIIGVIGFVAVIVIILGGVSYTTSAGDPGKVKKAKDTIMYGIVGLVIALLAFAIVNFVLSSILGNG